MRRKRKKQEICKPNSSNSLTSSRRAEGQVAMGILESGVDKNIPRICVKPLEALATEKPRIKFILKILVPGKEHLER